MVQIIAGKKGKGKTKEMLKEANNASQHAKGAVIYVDKSAKHMYELNNTIRMCDISDYPIHTCEGMLGFVSGLIASNHDTEYIFFDSFLKTSHLENSSKNTICKIIEQLDLMSENMTFVISLCMSEPDLPDKIKDKVLIAC